MARVGSMVAVCLLVSVATVAAQSPTGALETGDPTSWPQTAFPPDYTHWPPGSNVPYGGPRDSRERAEQPPVEQIPRAPAVQSIDQLLDRVAGAQCRPSDLKLLEYVARLVEREVAQAESSPTTDGPNRRLVVRLHNVAAEDIANGLKARSKETQSTKSFPVLVVDKANNAILLSGSANQVDDVARRMGELDKRRAMLQVEIKIAELRPAKGGAAAADAKAPSAEKDPEGWLDWATQNERLMVLSRTKSMTMDGQWAGMLTGNNQEITRLDETGRLTFPLHSDAISLPQLKEPYEPFGHDTRPQRFVWAGTSFIVLPRIAADGRITVDLMVRQSTRGHWRGRPLLRTSEAHTTVSARDGQTLVLTDLVHPAGDDQRPVVVVLTPQIHRQEK